MLLPESELDRKITTMDLERDKSVYANSEDKKVQPSGFKRSVVCGEYQAFVNRGRTRGQKKRQDKQRGKVAQEVAT
jgi:hypothetical protein